VLAAWAVCSRLTPCVLVMFILKFTAQNSRLLAARAVRGGLSPSGDARARIAAAVERGLRRLPGVHPVAAAGEFLLNFLDSASGQSSMTMCCTSSVWLRVCFKAPTLEGARSTHAGPVQQTNIKPVPFQGTINLARRHGG